MRNKSTQPEVKIERTQFDWQVELIAVVGLVILLLLPVLYYDQLPDSIPIHFGLNGQPDGYAGKEFIWLLPVLGIVVYIIITLAARSTKNINWPIKTTPENRIRVYTHILRMVRVLKVSVLAGFIHIVWSTIKTALGDASGVGSYFLPVFLLLVFGPMVYFHLKAVGKI